MLLLSNPNFKGHVWMTALSEKMWTSTDDESWVDLYGPLTEMLYEIGFIGFILQGERTPIYFYDDPALADNPSSMEKVQRFSVHPAYHLALGIKEDRGNHKKK